MTKTQFFQSIKNVNRPAVLSQFSTFNEYLIDGYKRQTGATTFKTFKQWKDEGYTVKKGESSFPVFSRPIAVIKAEKEQPASENDFKRFGVCHLFHEKQVERKEATA